eukprot:scaffold17273_cov97-Isochrysis_galbana.AAC.1
MGNAGAMRMSRADSALRPAGSSCWRARERIISALARMSVTEILARHLNLRLMTGQMGSPASLAFCFWTCSAQSVSKTPRKGGPQAPRTEKKKIYRTSRLRPYVSAAPSMACASDGETRAVASCRRVPCRKARLRPPVGP